MRYTNKTKFPTNARKYNSEKIGSVPIKIPLKEITHGRLQKGQNMLV